MTIDEKIQHVESELEALKQQKEQESKKDWPDVVGKCYYPYANCVIKVVKLTDYDPTYNEISADCISINIDKTSVSVDNDSSYSDFKLDSEISKEVFNSWYDKAINFINEQKI